MKPYPASVTALIGDRLPELGRGRCDEAIRPRLAALTPTSLTEGRPIDSANADAAACCLAGLWLLHDFHDEAHAIVQDIPSTEASYWHAIIHRREPDAWNSKYWFRRVGEPAILEELQKKSPALGYTFTKPENFVDFCEQVRGTNTSDEKIAKEIQKLEWELLFDFCFRRATGQ